MVHIYNRILLSHKKERNWVICREVDGTKAKKTKTLIRQDVCTPLFIGALFTIARSWKQPKCPSTDEWIKKLWYIYTMEYYSAIKRNEIGSFVERWMDLETDRKSVV